MKNLLKEKLLSLSIVFVLSMNFLFCHGQSGAVSLTYNYPDNKPVKYYTEGKMTQTMDVMGQSMQVYVNSVFGCSVKGAGKLGKNLKLEIVIDTMAQKTDSPMGSTGGAMNEVKGKSFNIVISPQGKSVDISEAEKVVYTIEGSGESNMAETFINFFPALPPKAVKPGEVWNSTDSINTKTSVMSMKMLVNSENKLEGTETVNGVECLKIASNISGNRIMKIQSQGNEILMTGPFTGTSECFFSVKDGYFIRQVVKSKLTGKLEITVPEAMTFPVVMDIESVNEVK